MSATPEQQRKYYLKNKERKTRLINQGVCVECMGANDRQGMHLCSTCYGRHVARRQRKLVEISNGGFCTSCLKPWVGKNKTCPSCVAKIVAGQKEKYNAGICARCGGARHETSRFCIECKAYKKDFSNAKRANFKESGMCSKCGTPRDNGGKNNCKECSLKILARQHLNDVDKYVDLKAIFDQQEGRCAYSGVLLEIGNGASVDHIIPRSAGGKNSIENVQWVSWDVNRMKNKLFEKEFIHLCGLITDKARSVDTLTASVPTE